MRFGLDRMHRLMTALGHPERRFDSIHVVGTNGKSSTVRMIAAILAAPRAAHRRLPVAAPASRSPSGSGSTTRDLEPAAFAAAVQRAAHAAELVDRSLERRRPRHPVRGADRRGLLRARPARGRGRGDRGRPRRPLRRHQRDPVAGPGADQRRPRAHALARADDRRHRRREARRGAAGRRRSCSAPACTPTRTRGRRRVAAERRRPDRAAPAATRASPVGALGAFQRRNFALARGRRRGLPGRARRRRGRRGGGAEVRVPGGCRSSASEPLTLLDGAHNPDGMAALAESLPELVARPRPRRRRRLDPRRQGRRRDAAPRCCRACDALVFTSSQNPRALPPPTLAVAGRVSSTGPPSEVVRDPRAAVRARAGARRRRTASCSPPARSTSSPTCSRPAGQRPRLDAVNDDDDHPSFLTMIGLVALIVAVVILVFFGIGYLFGRVFL